MAIPSRQIGAPSGTKAELLWNISKQLESLTGVMYNNPVYTTPTTTTTTTTEVPTTTTTTTIVMPNWIFQGGVNLEFPTNQNGYTLYEGGWTQYDDGQSTGVIDFAGDFLADGVTETQYRLSTNGYLLAVNSNFQVSGNRQDLYLTPGDPLSDGDIQNFWYKNINTETKWKTSILVYCGHCCGPESQATPYSYILNVYRDGNAQYVEARIKTSQENIGIAGINSFDIGEDASILSQVWQSDLAGSTWTYLGFGSII